MRQTRVACGLLWLAAAAVAGTFDDLHRAESAANPPDVKYVLKTSTGQTTFRPGEKIPITLEFSSPSPAKYRLDAAAYDRGGRLYFDHYFADREDAVDERMQASGSHPTRVNGRSDAVTLEPFRSNRAGEVIGTRRRGMGLPTGSSTVAPRNSPG